MNALTSTVTGCGSSQCGCASSSASASPAALPPELDFSGAGRVAAPGSVARINGVALHAEGEYPDAETLRERAYGELLRQQAVRAGLLPASDATLAPELGEAERDVLETMVDAAVQSPLPTEEECARMYEANPGRFVTGQALHVRHILLAVTPGVNVQALVVRAEKALLELSRKDVPPGRFEALAAELSNCPSSAQGGDLGWVGPEDCAPELADELFHQKHAQWGMGVHPRLVHTRFGFHIIEVLGRRKGRTQPYAAVRERIAAQLTLQSRARALHQYMGLLAGQAQVEGVELDTAGSPLVQ